MSITLRRSILPRSVRDACVTVFSLLMIPTVSWFELFVVLPVFYKPWGLVYVLHVLAGVFIVFNIISNFVAIVLTDTSIKGRILQATLDPEWKFCATCESVAPPRSWHCQTCDICILKRDHHCMFTSCCIGFYNHRYFMMFTFYIFLGLSYMFIYNTLYIWDLVEFKSWTTIVKILFPLATLFVDLSSTQLFLFLYLLLTILAVFTGLLMYHHTDLILKGKINYERKKKDNKYNVGRQRNIEVVMGKRWHLAWISPFIESKLPGDGIHWTTTESYKTC